MNYLGILILTLCVLHVTADGPFVDVVNEDEYYHVVQNKHKITLAYFYAPWCGPCLPFEEDFEKLKEVYPNKVFFRINVELFRPEFFDFIDMKSIPTVFLYENGDLIDSLIGHTPDNVKKLQDFASKISDNSLLEDAKGN